MHAVNGASAHDLQLPRRRCSSHRSTGNLGRKTPLRAERFGSTIARKASVSRDPGLRPPASHCCRDGKHRSEYETCPDDPRVVRRYAARESVAISRGQNDSGMFEQQQISGSESAKLCSWNSIRLPR
jgi:hypothetical protein